MSAWPEINTLFYDKPLARTMLGELTICRLPRRSEFSW
jgi:hypothetical protein